MQDCCFSFKKKKTAINAGPGFRKKFELSGVRVIGSSKKIAESKKQFLLHSEHFNHI